MRWCIGYTYHLKEEGWHCTETDWLRTEGVPPHWPRGVPLPLAAALPPQSPAPRRHRRGLGLTPFPQLPGITGPPLYPIPFAPRPPFPSQGLKTLSPLHRSPGEGVLDGPGGHQGTQKTLFAICRMSLVMLFSVVPVVMWEGVEARYVKKKLRYSEGCFFSVIPRGEELCEGGAM